MWALVLPQCQIGMQPPQLLATSSWKLAKAKLQVLTVSSVTVTSSLVVLSTITDALFNSSTVLLTQ